MKTSFYYIKGVVLLIAVLGLFAFSNSRNNARKIAESDIRFLGQDNLYITESTVSKLLIQNQGPITEQPKEIIDLNDLEAALNSNPMIKKAEVFMSLNGKLSVEIEQKQPIARVSTNEAYYIDDDGGYMPLSSNYSARVPLVIGVVDRNHLETVYQFAKAVHEDEFLKKHVIEIRENTDHTIDFKVRQSDFSIHLGSLKKLEKKLNNFKVFYQKALKDKRLDTYKMVNLKFDKQVICTKK